MRGASIFVRHLFRAVATLVALTALTYFMLELTVDGGVASLVLGGCPSDATTGLCGDIVDHYRLNDPVPVRYLKWLGDAVQGDLNVTTRNGASVLDVITDKAPITTELALASIVLAVGMAVPLGVYSAYRDDRVSGRAVSSAVQTMQSIPVFVSGLLFIWLFAEYLHWLPATGWVRLTDSLTGNLRTLVLPALTLSFAEVGVFARVIRADILQTFEEDFVNAAKAKGLKPTYLLFRHVLRPSSLGLMTVVGLNLSALLGGALVVEIVFGIGGIGPRLLEAIETRDVYMIQGITLYIGAIYVIINAFIDFAYGRMDPRLQRGGRG